MRRGGSDVYSGVMQARHTYSQAHQDSLVYGCCDLHFMMLAETNAPGGTLSKIA